MTDTESAKPAASKRAIRFRATLLAMIGLALLLGGYAYEAGNMAAQFHGSSIHDLSSKIIAKPTALIVAAFSSIGFLILSYLYLHYADEHERHANLWANTNALYAFVAVAPAWQVLSKARLAPPLDMWIIVVMISGVASATWLWLKFR